MRNDPSSVTFAALADPTRRAILARLSSGECTVGELAGISRDVRDTFLATGMARGAGVSYDRLEDLVELRVS